MSHDEYGPCAHAVRTCDWVCPEFELGSITMRWLEAERLEAELKVRQDTIPVTDPIRAELGWKKGAGPDTIRFDAMIFTATAYDLFVLPDLIVTHGYDKARIIRTRHRACLKTFGVCIHRIECDWVCPRIGWRDMIEWKSHHNLRNVFDALVLTPSAYERFALPFQVRTRGAARAAALHRGYLGRVREEEAFRKGIWPKAKAPARPAGGKQAAPSGHGTRRRS